MKADVLALAAGRKPAKGPSKETLNHPGIIERATGIDPAVATPQAYRAAYARLGIDIVNRVPDRHAPPPTKPGETRDLGDGYVAGHLGVYDTVTRQEFPFEESRRLIGKLSQADCPFVFLHDDLADKRGPLFPPDWYDRYIFPRYPALFESILETFGDAIVIGGIDTGILQHGEAAQIREHVLEVHDRTAARSGFAMSTPGGLHGSLPLSNLEAYFDARVETGHTPPNWRAR